MRWGEGGVRGVEEGSEVRRVMRVLHGLYQLTIRSGCQVWGTVPSDLGTSFCSWLPKGKSPLNGHVHCMVQYVVQNSYIKLNV